MAAESMASTSTMLSNNNDVNSQLEEFKIKNSEELKEYMKMELHPSSFSRLKILEARKCDQGLTKFLSFLLLQPARLEELSIANCKLLEEVINLGDLDPDDDDERHVPLLPKLHSMRLWDLPKLNSICNKDVKLGNLVELEIIKCGFLKGPLPTSLLVKLVSLKIELCDMIEQVIEKNAEMQESLFLKLRFLRLVSLPNLTKFNSTHCILTFPQLEGVLIAKCPQLDTFSQDVSKTCLDTLKRLRLIGMPRILFLTLPNDGKLSEFSVRNLEIMEIVDCNDLQYVFAIENKEGVLSFPALYQLGLSNLGELRGIVKQDTPGITLSFQMLTHLTVCNCNKLRYVLPFHVLQSLGKLENIEIRDCEMLERVFGQEQDTRMRQSNEHQTANTCHQLLKVKSLILEKLPKFSGCCQDGCIVEWLSSMKVRVVECPMIQKLSLGMIERPLLALVEVVECNNTWENNGDIESNIAYLFELKDEHSKRELLSIKDFEDMKNYMEILEHRPSSFSKLRLLWIKQCDQELTKFLSILFSRSHELEELIVESCQFIEQVFDLNNLASDDQQEPPLFHNLMRIILSGLPKLNFICNNDAKFGNLVELQIIKCDYLKGPLPIALLEKLKFLRIELCEMIEQVVEENVEMQESLFLNLQFIRLVRLPKLTKFNPVHYHLTFPKLEGLWIEKCPELDSFSQDVIKALFNALKHLKLIGMPRILFLKLSNNGHVSEFSVQNLEVMEIVDCNDIQYLFFINSLITEKNKEGGFVFPALRKLGLQNMGELRGIMKQHYPGRTLSFEMLTHLTVCSCNRLRCVLPLHVLQSLRELENIEIRDCEMLERVFGDEQDAQMISNSNENATANTCHQLPKVKSLILEHLPKFTCFCLDGCDVEWLSLEKVRVVECDMIEKSSLGKIDISLLTSVEVIKCNSWASSEGTESNIGYLFELTDELSGCEILSIEDSEKLKNFIRIIELRPSSFSKLRLLGAKQCNQEFTKFLSILQSRSHELEQLRVENCQLLEQVFNLQDLAPHEQGPPLFPNLMTMILCDLPNLNFICNIKLSKLVRLEIIECGCLKGPLSTAILEKLVVLNIESCEMIEQVVESNSEMQEKLFLNLDNLRLVNLPMLTKFNSARCNVTFSKLQSLWIENCPRLNAFTSRYLHDKGAFSQAVNKALLDSLRHLKLVQMPRVLFLTLSSSGWLWECSLRNLETMVIRECNDLQYLFVIEGAIEDTRYYDSSNIREEELLFPTLHQLYLCNLGEFKGMVRQDSPGRTLSFQMLTDITIWSCNKLKYVLPLHVLHNLRQLEKIVIGDCKMLETVFGDEEDPQMRIKVSTKTTIKNIVHQLPKVKSLILEKLPKFCGCCQDGYTVEWLLLEKVKVVECPMIQKLSFGMIGRPLLRSVEVIECNNTWASNDDPESNIVYLFHLTEARMAVESLVSHLKELKLKDSDELKNYVEMDLQQPSSFSKLKILEARQCDQELNKFLSILLCQSHELIEQLIVENCELLEQVFNFRDFDSKKEESHILLPQLQAIRLCGLPKLNCICSDDVQLGNLVKLEIIRCGFLKGPLPNALLKKLVILKIESCEMIEQVIEGNMIGDMFHNLEDLQLVSLPKLTKFISEVFILSFPKLRSLRIEKCPGLDAFPTKDKWISVTGSFYCAVSKVLSSGTLKHLKLIGMPKIFFLKQYYHEYGREQQGQKWETLEIVDCNDLHYIFWITGSVFLELLTTLCQLRLCNLRNFEGLVSQKTSDRPLSFRMLKHLTVSSCNRLRYIIPYYVLSSLEQLEHIEIRDCKRMEQVFGDRYSSFTNSSDRKLPKVKNLILEELPKLDGCCEGNINVTWHSLENVRVVKCPKIQKSSLGMVERPLLKSVEVNECDTWANNEDPESNIVYLFHLTDELSTLEKLEINDSEELKNYMSSYLIGLRILEIRQCDQELSKFLSILSRRSHELEEVTIANCQQLEQVFHLTNLAPNNNKHGPPLFPKLHTIRLWDLPKLNVIWNKDVEIGKLVKLDIIRCGFLKGPLSTASLAKLVHLKELKIEACEMIEHVLEDDMEMQERSFPNLKDLQLVSLPKLIKFNSGYCNLKFPELVSLRVEECPKLNAFTTDGASDHVPPTEILDACPELQKLKLVGHESAEIWTGHFSYTRDCDLKDVEVDSFSNLRYVFPSSMLPRLLKLETMVVRNCNSLSNLFQLRENDSIMTFQNLKIIKVNGCNSLEHMLLCPSSYPKLTEIDVSDCQSLKDIFIDTGINADETCFSNLESMVLENLPMIPSFSQDIYEFPKLQKVVIVNCPGIKRFSRNVSAKASNFVDKDSSRITPFSSDKMLVPPQLQVLELSDLPEMQLWNQEPHFPVFENLTSLKIIRGASLKKLFSISVAEHVSHLKLLTLYRCENMVQVLEGGGRGNSKKVFQNLEILVLKHLPLLTSFCREDVDFGEFPMLRMVRVDDVPKMETFVKKSVKTPKLKQVHVTFIRKFWTRNLNETIESLHEIHDQLEKKVWKSDLSSTTTSYGAESSSQQGKFKIEGRSSRDEIA